MLPGLKKRVINFHDVLMYVAIARRHLRLMLLLMCFSWLSGLVYYVYARPVFYARALVKVDNIETQGKLNVEQQFGQTYRLGSILQEMAAPHIVQRTAASLGVKADYRTIVTDYIKRLTIKQNSEKNLEIEVYPYSHDWAKRWCQSLVEEYKKYRSERRIEEQRQREENFIRDYDEQTKLLAGNQERLVKSRAALNTEQATIEYDKLRPLHSDLVEVGRRLQEVGEVKLQILDPRLSAVEQLSRISAVTDRPLKLGQTNSSAVGADGKPQPKLEIITPDIASQDNSWQQLDTELHTLQVEKENAAETYLDEHKVMVEIQLKISAVQLKIEGELRRHTARLDAFHRQLLDKEKELTAKLPNYEVALAKYNNIRQQEELINDSLVNWKNTLALLIKEREQERDPWLRERVAINYENIQQINDTPVSPNRMSLLVYTTILGILLALGIPFLLEYLDHTLSNLEQVESQFQLRGLGIVPKLESDETTSVGLFSRDSKESTLLENFRVIRTNLLSMGSLSKPPHVLMVTSAMPKEGKTVVSSNLALSFAQAGNRTLLLDTDLRRGRLHRLFGYRKQPGLSGVLLGQITLDEAIRPTPHENLFVLSTGQHLETGTELLGSQKFKDIMLELRKRYDRIVVDTPPVLGLSETSVIQNDVDGVLFVIWSGHTPIKGVRAAIEMLQGNGANFYGFVLNRLDLSATANYYQYYYYSHDYYYHYSPRALENAQ